MTNLLENNMIRNQLNVLDENLSFESIDAAIESSLKKLVDFFDADRCHLGELLPDQSKIIVPYFYSRPDLNIPQTTDVGNDYLPFVYEQVRENKLLAFTKSAELPKQASQDRTVTDNMGWNWHGEKVLSFL